MIASPSTSQVAAADLPALSSPGANFLTRNRYVGSDADDRGVSSCTVTRVSEPKLTERSSVITLVCAAAETRAGPTAISGSLPRIGRGCSVRSGRSRRARTGQPRARGSCARQAPRVSCSKEARMPPWHHRSSSLCGRSCRSSSVWGRRFRRAWCGTDSFRGAEVASRSTSSPRRCGGSSAWTAGSRLDTGQWPCSPLCPVRSPCGW